LYYYVHYGPGLVRAERNLELNKETTMPICVLLAPEGIADGSKERLMGKLTTHIHEAYPNTVTEVFLQEIDRSLVMVNGIRLSANPSSAAGAREVRLCTLLCPPGIRSDAKKAMMERVTADIAEAYPTDGDIWVVHREDDPASAMLNGGLLSEKYGRGPGH
jgi:phenylpyruvate tautomerase PptA (4-oxalocrotonate tautomerase family)